MIASIRSHVRRFDVKFVVVDYVQRIKVPTRDANILRLVKVVDDLQSFEESWDQYHVAVSNQSWC